MAQPRQQTLFGVAAIGLAVVACEGSTTPASSWGVGGSQPGAGSAGMEPGPTPDGFLESGEVSSAPLRRLTRVEYQNVVREVLGVEPPDAHALPEDSLASGFRSTANQLTTIAAANRYLDAAVETGQKLEPTIRDLVPCSASDLAGERSCIDGWLTSFGPRLFRRPMTDEERSRYVGAFERARSTEAYEQSASLMIEALLVAPELLFVELPSGGDAGTVHPLDSWQVASRLSLLLWDSVPDQPLLEAAARGELTSRAALTEHVERLLGDPRARASVRTFFDDWLGFGKIESAGNDKDAYPFIPRDLAAAFAEETRRYAEEAFWQDRDFRRLFVSSARIRNARLSIFYQDGLGTSDDMARYEADVSEHSFGLLSQAGFLMTLARSPASAPIHRGAFVRRKLLCGRLSPPPPGVATPLPEQMPGMTTREGITLHTAGAACAPCHDTFNPLGFALEHFDVAGAWRDVDRKLPIDAHATFDEPGFQAEVSGARELSEALAQSPRARACALQQLFSFALERAPTSADQAWFDELGRKFEASGFDLEALLAELVLSDSFRSRIEPEGLP